MNTTKIIIVNYKKINIYIYISAIWNKIQIFVKILFDFS